jgi:hypothetical protein
VQPLIEIQPIFNVGSDNEKQFANVIKHTAINLTGAGGVSGAGVVDCAFSLIFEPPASPAFILAAAAAAAAAAGVVDDLVAVVVVSLVVLD